MESVLIKGIPYDLPAIEQDCWYRLVNGSLRSKDAMQTPAVANINANGVNMRTVVLRKVCYAEKQLVFYTDIRSGKWAELQLQNNISWLFYDAKARVQIRAGGMAVLHHTDDLSDNAWAMIKTNNRKDYLSERRPSSEIISPKSEVRSAPVNAGNTTEQREAGRDNFGVVLSHIRWMEWLWLSSEGHCRAAFVYNEAGSYTANWLVP